MRAKNTLMRKAILVAAVFCLVSALPYAYAVDRDDNPPGTNWENPPGPRGGPGASPDRRSSDGRWWDRDNNPPGPSGGPGTNWENPPGPRGGPGTSPNR
jgi:hypothetical protein